MLMSAKVVYVLQVRRDAGDVDNSFAKVYGYAAQIIVQLWLPYQV